MATVVLGISAYYHDSAAAIVCDGRIVAAAQEERFSRVKHDSGFPIKSVEYCFDAAGIATGQLDYVVFYEKPLLKFDRLLETWVACAPAGFSQFSKALPLWLKRKLFLPREMDRAIGGGYGGRYVFTEHHEAHAAAAFFPSPFDHAAVLTMDGVGEWATASIGTGNGNRIELAEEIRFPHSLGLLYSAFTYYTGFKVNGGEYKMMGLAPYGRPRYVDLILDRLMDLKDDGSFALDMSYFTYCKSDVMVSAKFVGLFGAPARRSWDPILQVYMDAAASVQAVTEQVILRAARYVHDKTGMSNLAMSGGVALNCVANGRLLREGPFDDIWIQPAAGDAGGALGAALFVWYQLLGNRREAVGDDIRQTCLLGPAYTGGQIREFLDGIGVCYRVFGREDELLEEVAGMIAEGKVIGWFQGRMEFGPRALGNRSILADARDVGMQSRINLQVKFRESFRPFAPCVLAEDAGKYFELDRPSPYMLLVAAVQTDKRLVPEPGQEALLGLERLKVRRSGIPAVTHVDYSARIQTVEKIHHPRLHRLMSIFSDKTGCGVLINTSFNVRGEPVVCTPQDAYRCFNASGLDALVIEDVLVVKQAATG